MKLNQNHAESAAVGHNRSRIELVPVAVLKVREGDPRRYSPRDIELAQAALRQLPVGVPLPVVVNAEGEILVGGLFVAAARKLEIKNLAVIHHEGLSEIEEKQYSVAINQLLSKGEWDPVALEAWVREFEAGLEDFSHLALGFDNGELDNILGMAGALAGGGGDEAPPLETNAVSRVGMTWLAGRHRVMCGSATSPGDMSRLMAGHLAAMAITDPPYGCKVDGFVSKKGKHRDFVEGAGEMRPDELGDFFLGFTKNLAANLQKGALVYVFIDWRSLDLLQRACEQVFGSLIQLCCWVKNRAGMGSLYRSQHELVLVFKNPGAKHRNNVKLGINGRNRSNVWDYPSAASSRSGREGDILKHHPTPKPVEMIADAMLDCTEHGDRIIDCFLGSGTALIAAERTGRICHGMELDPLYVDVAIRRWQAWTGLEATDAETGMTFNELAALAQLTEESRDD
ncbi:MAG: DNA modification methylase [Sphingomonadaceae bacterium]|nr:DNA modification methylase [Sphingomonadaceae bacterium]